MGQDRYILITSRIWLCLIQHIVSFLICFLTIPTCFLLVITIKYCWSIGLTKCENIYALKSSMSCDLEIMSFEGRKQMNGFNCETRKWVYLWNHEIEIVSMLLVKAKWDEVTRAWTWYGSLAMSLRQGYLDTHLFKNDFVFNLYAVFKVC